MLFMMNSPTFAFPRGRIRPAKRDNFTPSPTAGATAPASPRRSAPGGWRIRSDTASAMSPAIQRGLASVASNRPRHQQARGHDRGEHRGRHEGERLAEGVRKPVRVGEEDERRAQQEGGQRDAAMTIQVVHRAPVADLDRHAGRDARDRGDDEREPDRAGRRRRARRPRRRSPRRGRRACAPRAPGAR